jgi:hypothetical protein
MRPDLPGPRDGCLRLVEKELSVLGYACISIDIHSSTGSDLAIFKIAAISWLSWVDSPDRAALGTYSRVAEIVGDAARRR